MQFKSRKSDCWWQCEEPQHNDAYWSFPNEYTRQTKTFQGVKLRARGYINPDCLRNATPCTTMISNKFRAEYTAQAHAIRELSKLRGRLSYYERNIERDPIDNNVDWEVGPGKGAAKQWRIDIVVDDRSIIEVKHVSKAHTVDRQLRDYRDWARQDYGVLFTFNRELNAKSWAVKYEEPQNGFDGPPTWYAWAPPDKRGHVYFAREDEDVPQWVRDDAKHVGPGDASNVEPVPIPIRPPIPAPPLLVPA